MMRSYFTALAAALVLGLANAPAPARADVHDLPDFADLVEKVGPGVVNIRITERVKVGAERGSADDPDIDELMRRFGIPPKGKDQAPRSKDPRRNDDLPDREQDRGVGSGFILSADGYIMTNAHVLEGASEIYVTLTDKREFKGKVIGSDERTDVALVKIEANNLPKMALGDSRGVRVGQWVLAIGSPFGLENTVSAGIVSAKGRDTGEYLRFIQTDVAINPGNSGGPLINMKGEVIGVNSQIISNGDTGGSIGISFAIPIEQAVAVSEQLRLTGKVTRGRLGVQISELTRDQAEAIGLSPQGAVVSRVEKGTPADKAGILAGDIILKFDNQVIEHMGDLPRAVGDTKPGSRSVVQVWRKGRTRDIPVVVAELGDDAAPGGGAESPRVGGTPINPLGLVVGELTDQRRRELGISGGVDVVRVDGPALAAELRTGDVVLQLNTNDITGGKQLSELVAKLDPKKQAYLLVMRGDVVRYVPIKPAG